jgi:acyl dehydratase
MFDGSKRMTLTGTVREFQWTNPHSYIQLVVKQPDGTEQEWSLEMGANAYLYNLGWRPSTVKPGDTLTVKVDPLRNGSHGGLLVEALTADGKTLGRRP